MGDSADTAREKLQAKRKLPVKPVPKRKPSVEEKAFGAQTAIFVPPALQHEGKKPPSRGPFEPEPETAAQRKARLIEETRQRERARLGLKITAPTGANRLDAVPVRGPSNRYSLLGGMLTIPHWYKDLATVPAAVGKGLATTAAHTAEDWAGDVARVPGNLASSLLYGGKSGTRLSTPLPVPRAAQHAGEVLGTTEPLVRPLGKTAEFIGSEKGQEQIWGKSLVNLALHGDLPGSKGEAAGLTLGIIGILPFGKFAQLARAGKLARAASKIGEALPDTPERDAWRAVLSAKYGEEPANDVMLVTDQMARNQHPDNPNAFYEQTSVHSAEAGKFTPTGQEVRFQTTPGPRQGLLEGAGHPTETPVFYSPLQRAIARLPGTGMKSASLQNGLRRMGISNEEWDAMGLDSFFGSYTKAHPRTGERVVDPYARIPYDDFKRYVSNSLNSYNLNEMVRASHGAQDAAHNTIWDREVPYEEVLIARTPTADQPYHELTMTLGDWLPRQTKVGHAYQGKGASHWGDENVVVHIRFHMITDPEGKSAMLIDEIQSDWLSEWRARGSPRWGEMNKEDAQRLAEIEQELAQVRSTVVGLPTKESVQDARHAAFRAESAHRDWPGGDPAFQEMLRQNAEDANARLQQAIDAFEPHRDTWQEYALNERTLRYERDLIKRKQGFVPPPLGGRELDAAVRRASRWAAEAEADRIIVVPGEMQGYRNNAFGKLPDGRDVNLTEFHPAHEEHTDNWRGAFGHMTTEELKRFGRSPLGRESGSAKTFFRLYEEQIPALFEKVLGGKGSFRDRAFHGYYADQVRGLPDHGEDVMGGFVIDLTPEMKAKALQPMALFQQRAWEALPKGATEFFADGRKAIYLFENADISTILHELSHVALPDLPEVDRAILARHFNNFKTTADHEAYARAFERYIYEGKAMTSELDGTFAKLKQWMAAVYQHVNQLGAHLHPEVQQVFDRMLIRPETPEQQLVRLLKRAPGVRRAQQAGYSEERARRIAAMFEQWTPESSIEEYNAALSELSGELPRQEYTDLHQLPDEAVAALIKSIRVSTRARPYEKVRAAEAILKATEGSEVPTHSELKLLEKIFGKDVGFKKVERHGLVTVALELINLPRSIAASFDLSAPLRQGLVAGARHPVLFSKNFPPMIKAALKEKYVQDVAEDIATRPTFPLMQKAKLAVETHAANPFAEREEQFYSSYADRFIPPVHWSGRAYETFLHKMRADVFDHMVATALSRGKDVSDEKFLRAAGRYVNSSTGRGVMPENEILNLEKAAVPLNTFLFSPRLLASRVNMISPFYYAKLYRDSPFVAAQAARSALHTLTLTAMILGIADQMPGVSVGLDPTSANFAKIRIGDTRIDILGGFSQVGVLIMREFYGKSTSSTTGKTQNLRGGYGSSSRWDILVRFGESKMAPTPGVVRDLLMNQTFIGQPVTWKTEGANMIPMLWRDMWDAGHEPNDPTSAMMAAAAVAVLGGFGFGFSTYANKKPAISSGGSTPSTSQGPFESDGGGGGGSAPSTPFESGGGGGVPSPFE